jgi:hypothetical protein
LPHGRRGSSGRRSGFLALLELAANGYEGVINVAGPDVINRCNLGVLVAQRDGLDPALVPAGSIADQGLRLPANVQRRSSIHDRKLDTPHRSRKSFWQRRALEPASEKRQHVAEIASVC